MPEAHPYQQIVSLYSDGDIPSEWIPSLASHDVEALQGLWEVMPERSDTCDEIFAALNVGAIKRSALRNYRSRVEIRVMPQDEGAPMVYIVTNLPMGFKKEGTVYTDGRSCDYPDKDTGVVWTNESVFLNGRLYQRRVSKLGTMFDVRCVFLTDPEGLTEQRGPFQLFKMTLIDRKGRKMCAYRWMKKIK